MLSCDCKPLAAELHCWSSGIQGSSAGQCPAAACSQHLAWPPLVTLQILLLAAVAAASNSMCIACNSSVSMTLEIAGSKLEANFNTIFGLYMYRACTAAALQLPSCQYGIKMLQCTGRTAC
jgi:hypothetical protein